MSRGPGITQSQPGGGNILFFGNPPYPTTGYLRAGNDAGVILTYRNNANTKDLPGIGVGPQGGANQDFFLFAGVLAGELTSAPGASPVVGILRPPTTIGGGGGVAFGDTFTPFSQVVAETLYAVSHYDGIHTPTQFLMHFVYDGAGEHSELTTQDASLFFNAGGIHTVVELFNIGSHPGRQVFRPYNANTVGLGDAANPWYGLFLKAGDVTVPPLTFDPAGVAPGAPANGQAWFTAAGLFYRAGGVTVGPLAAAASGSVGVLADSAPAVPSIYDDEFTGAALDAKWTLDAGGGAGSSVAFQQFGTLLQFLCPGLAVGNAYQFHESVAAVGAAGTPFQVTCKVGVNANAGDLMISGVEVNDGGAFETGNFVDVQIRSTAGGDYQCDGYDGGVLGATVIAKDSGTVYLHLQRNAANLLRLYVSADGVSWRQIYSGAKGWNIVNLFVRLYGNTSVGVNSINMIDWVRVNDARFTQNF